MGIVVSIAVLGAGAALAQQGDRLTTARFAAIDSVYTAFVALGDSAGAAADVRRACDALDGGDRLLAATRTACLSTLRIAPARRAFAACQTARECSRAAGRIRVAVGRALADSRASNRVVAGALAPGPCRGELTVSRDQLRSMQRLRDGMRLLQRGLLTRERAVIRRAEQLIASSVRLADNQPTTQQSRETFRHVCAPDQGQS